MRTILLAALIAAGIGIIGAPGAFAAPVMALHSFRLRRWHAIVPVAVFLGLMYAASYHLVRRFYVFQVWLLIATAGVVAVTLVAALSGVDVARCLVILMLAPTVTVVGSEVRVAETPSP